MARLIAYTSPARGHLYPIVATLVALRDRGHEVHVRTLASEVAALRALGLYAGPLAPEIEALPLDDWRGSSPEDALAGGLRTFAARAAHEVPDLRRAVVAVRPHVLLVDVVTAGASALAEASGLPWAQWSPFLQHLGGGEEEEPTLVPFTLMPAGMEALAAPRRLLGLPPIRDPAEAWRAPLVLYLTGPPLVPAGAPHPPALRPVGPGLWEPPGPSPEWLEEPGDPLVLVTASSEYQRDDALVAAALEALRTEPVRVVASTVAHAPGGFAAPPGARVARWLPHGPVVRRAACVVCHGGMGIVQRALSAGVPLCVVPFGRDQTAVAARVAAIGAGVHLPAAALEPRALRAAVRRAMTMREGARRAAEALRAGGGAPAAARLVEALLDHRPTDRRELAGHAG